MSQNVSSAAIVIDALRVNGYQWHGNFAQFFIIDFFCGNGIFLYNSINCRAPFLPKLLSLIIYPPPPPPTFIHKVRKLAKIRNRLNQVDSTTPDPKYNMWKCQKHNYTKRSAFSQQVTTRLQWTDAKAWQTQDINNTNDPQQKYRLRTVSKNILL